MSDSSRSANEILHPGEIEAQRRFEAAGAWSEERLNRMFRTELDHAAATFIQSQLFFFIATSDDQGHCDASFRGCEYYGDGRPQPPVKVMDTKTLLFPDFAGNKLYNSFGNILRNPHIGMLFIDFQNAIRIRINGGVEILEDRTLYQELWPGAQRYVKVSIEQIFGNCKKRIPKLKLAE